MGRLGGVGGEHEDKILFLKSQFILTHYFWKTISTVPFVTVGDRDNS